MTWYWMLLAWLAVSLIVGPLAGRLLKRNAAALGDPRSGEGRAPAQAPDDSARSADDPSLTDLSARNPRRI